MGVVVLLFSVAGLPGVLRTLEAEGTVICNCMELNAPAPVLNLESCP